MWIEPDADDGRGERVARSTGRQVQRGLGRPAEGRVDEQARRVRIVKFRANRQLTDAQAPIVEMLLVPQLVEAGGSRRLDAAGEMQIADVVRAQPAPMDLIGAREDLAAHMEAGAQIDFQIGISDAFIARALAQPASQIAEDLAGLGDGERDSGLAEPVPQLEIQQLLAGIAGIIRLVFGARFRRGWRLRVFFLAGFNRALVGFVIGLVVGLVRGFAGVRLRGRSP